MSEAKTPRFQWLRVLKLTVAMVILVPFSDMGFRKIEEWRAEKRAAAYLKKTHPHVELRVERVTPDWPTKDEWKVAFRIVNNPTVYRACVAIDSRGQFSSHYHSINDK